MKIEIENLKLNKQKVHYFLIFYKSYLLYKRLSIIRFFKIFIIKIF